jgi:threonylcarbamoyladenosine tRNA methylthiotransferase MtaB
MIPVIQQVLAPAWPDAIDGPSTAERFGDGDGSCGAAIEPGVAGRTAFTLRVQTGCTNRAPTASFRARGRPVSVPPDRIVRDVERVVRAGFREIAITGVHLGSYGRDLSPASSLSICSSVRGRHRVAAEVS